MQDTQTNLAQPNTGIVTTTTNQPDLHNKIKELSQLADLLEGHRAEKQTIVMCHGVFDLLHIGHIRHFEEAKKNGDILVVTITPDQYVNKGPDRPVFSEHLRAEAIAALGCVDYVAINQWQTAVEPIKLLRPDRYVKGPDYKDMDTDITGGIKLEFNAIESVGGSVIFTDDIVFSSSGLINRNLPVLTPEQRDYLKEFIDKYSCDDITRYFESMRNLKVLTVGEAIIDEYYYCDAMGKSSKEPMLVVKCTSSEAFAGGIFAVANNIANFSDKTAVLSFVGDQDSYEDFVRVKLKDTIDSKLIARRGSPTIVKKRFIESYFFHKLLSVYTINDNELDSEDNKILCATLEEIVPQYDVVVVVDFGHSMITPEAAKVLSDKAKFLAVNTQSNAGSLGYQSIYKYSRADYVCITEGELRLEVRERTGDIKQAIPKLANDLKCDQIVITQGKRGCLCYSTKDGFSNIPAFAGKVVDRMGAGDAFLSVTSLAASLKAPQEVLGFIGNAVGAQAVATVGHRDSINRITLTKFITSLLK